MLRDFAFGSCYDIFLVLQKENLNRGYHALLGLLSVRFQKTKEKWRDFAFGSCYDIFWVLQKGELEQGYHALLELMSVRFQKKKFTDLTLYSSKDVFFCCYKKRP